MLMHEIHILLFYFLVRRVKILREIKKLFFNLLTSLMYAWFDLGWFIHFDGKLCL